MLDSTSFFESPVEQKSTSFCQSTAEETYNRETTKLVIKSFQDGDVNVLTAKRVFDEGVDLPQIRPAFILSSTASERQWAQRRSRLLGTCSAICKTHSAIRDFLMLPRSFDTKLDIDARFIVRSEIRGALEFSRLARKAGSPGGPLGSIDRMVKAAYL